MIISIPYINELQLKKFWTINQTILHSSLVKSRSLIFNQIIVCYTTKIRSVKISNLLVNNMEQISVLFWARELNITKRSKLNNALLKNRQVFFVDSPAFNPFHNQDAGM